MTAPNEGPFAEAWDLFMTMDEDLAVAHGYADFKQETIDDGWDELPERIAAAKASLVSVAGPTDTRKERKASRHERHEIAGIDETLDEAYQALADRASAQTDYLKLEALAKEAIAADQEPDTVGLDMAMERMHRAGDRLESSLSTLSYRIENLAAEQG